MFKLAFRNIFRQKRRSFFTALGMVFGLVLISFSMSLTAGTYKDIIASFTGNHSGHIQIHNSDYLENPSLYKLIKSPKKIEHILKSDAQITDFTPRLYSGSLGFFKKKSTGVFIYGVDPVLENRTTHLGSKIESGSYFDSKNERTVIISSNISKTLKINLGDSLVLITQGVDGSVANDLYLVKGIVDTEKQGLIPNLVLMPLATLQELLAAGPWVHEYIVNVTDLDDVRITAKKISEKINFGDLDVQPWQVVVKDFYNAMLVDLKGNRIGLGILMIIVAIGILNTVLMSVLERTREFGVLKAIGSSPSFLFRLILLENFILATMSTCGGLIISLAVNLYFSKNGIQLSQQLHYGGMVFDSMKGALNIEVFLTPSLIIIGTTLLVSLWPGIRAARIAPILAMKAP